MEGNGIDAHSVVSGSDMDVWQQFLGEMRLQLGTAFDDLLSGAALLPPDDAGWVVGVGSERSAELLNGYYGVVAQRAAGAAVRFVVNDSAEHAEIDVAAPEQPRLIDDDDIPEWRFGGMDQISFTQVANNGIDDLVFRLNGNTVKLMLVVLRQTMGFFVGGVNRRWWVTSAPVIEATTGMKRNPISRAVNEGSKSNVFIVNNNVSAEMVRQFQRQYGRKPRNREQLFAIRCAMKGDF